MRTSAPHSLRDMLRAFRQANSGNVASMFALALVPLIGFVGVGIDYGRANAARTEMQSALDSAALMLSKEVGNLTSGQLQTRANEYFKALLKNADVSDLVITPTYKSNDGFSLTMTATGTVANDFVGVIGHKTTKIDALSQVRWGNSRIRVALVLDNTGSMKNAGKMDALKQATKNLLKQLKEAATKPEDVYVSIIPFSKDVNVGSANYNATWVDFSAWDDDQASCSKKKFKTKSACEAKGEVWTMADRKTWNGCVTDRGPAVAPNPQDWDRKIDPPSVGNPDSLYVAEQYDYCPQPLMPLSNDWAAMETLVDKMAPAGSTNQPIGLVWGWAALQGTSPLTVPAKDKSYTYQDVIILMSDGLNTQDRWYGNGSQVSPPVDFRMVEPSDGSGTCANIKKAGVTIYTMHVNTDGDPTSTLLQDCATDKSKFYLVTSANQMVSIFQKIGSTLSQLRLAK